MNRMSSSAAAVAAVITSCLSTISYARAPSTSAAKGTTAGGIQWFSRLKDGLAEARRTGKPILYLSAAPSCGGVPGIW